MKKNKRAAFMIAIGGMLGLLAVITGALGAHALEDQLTPGQLDSYETAVRFQMYHALAFLALGILMQAYGRQRLLDWVGWTWLLGVIMFSGSIYLLVLTPIKVGIVTPIGGMFLIMGWGLLSAWAVRMMRA